MRKIWPFSIAIFVLLLAALIFLLLPHLIRSKIDRAIASQNINIEYGNLKVEILSARVLFSDIRFDFRKDTLNRNEGLHGTLGEVNLSRISWWTLLKDKEIKARSITIANPVIKQLGDSIHLKDFTDLEEKGEELAFFADELKVEQAKFTHFKDSIAQLEIGSFNLLSRDFEYTRGMTTSAILSSGKFEVADILMRDKEHLYDIRMKKITGQVADSSCTINQISGTPRYDTDEFLRRVPSQTDLIKFNISEIQAVGFDILGLFRQRLAAGRIAISRFTFEDFIDKNLSHSDNHRHPLPHEVFRHLDYEVNIDSVVLRDGYIAYAELLPGESKAGEVMFNNINGHFVNITNDSAEWRMNDEISVHIECLLYGNGSVAIDAQFPMLAENNSYSYSGHLGNFEISKANEILAPATKMFFTSGTIDELAFQVQANSSNASGEMQFFYRDLDIDFLERKFVEGILDNIVEAFIFPQENVRTDKHYLGKIYANREINKSIFNYLWIAVLSGIQSTIMPNILLPAELKHQRVDGGK